jgi:hypothetical protein
MIWPYLTGALFGILATVIVAAVAVIWIRHRIAERFELTLQQGPFLGVPTHATTPTDAQLIRLLEPIDRRPPEPPGRTNAHP